MNPWGTPTTIHVTELQVFTLNTISAWSLVTKDYKIDKHVDNCSTILYQKFYHI